MKYILYSIFLFISLPSLRKPLTRNLFVISTKFHEYKYMQESVLHTCTNPSLRGSSETNAVSSQMYCTFSVYPTIVYFLTAVMCVYSGVGGGRESLTTLTGMNDILFSDCLTLLYYTVIINCGYHTKFLLQLHDERNILTHLK